MYCNECGKDKAKEFVLLHEFFDEEDNKIGEYEEKMCQCECGNIFTTEEQAAQNHKEVNDAFRKLMNPISFDDLCRLPRRYAISRKDFTTVMGFEKMHDFGDGMWERFDIWNGDCPNDDENYKLERVLNEPKYYIECLKKAEPYLKREVYERSLKRAEGLCGK